MRKLTLALGVAALMGSASLAQAAEVAVLDWREALMETDEAQRQMNELRSEIEGPQQEAQALGQELQALQQRLEQDGAVMSDSEREALLQEGMEKEQRFMQLRQQIGQAQMRSEQAFLQGAEPKLEQAVDQIIARHDIEVLIDRDGVIHTTLELTDVTDEVTEILNTLN
ncbi:OmpH/Skp family outer membrane protein [Halomonas sp. NCCP-2165]|nr:OmpH family outer membrane protein [Halomonas sp. NCCP-2165]GKW50750.1 hypothetical protein NCCP2165_29650 [Halomonas sp. NCCP-2165]